MDCEWTVSGGWCRGVLTLLVSGKLPGSGAFNIAGSVLLVELSARRKTQLNVSYQAANCAGGAARRGSAEGLGGVALDFT